MSHTESHVIGNTEYIFKTALDWFSLERVPEAQRFVVLLNEGEKVEDAASIAQDDLTRVEVVNNRAEYVLTLLELFLQSFEVDGEMRNVTRKRIMSIDPRHIPTLLQIAERLYRAQRDVVAEFEPGNPTA